jgi:hypothetical protein
MDVVSKGWEQLTSFKKIIENVEHKVLQRISYKSNGKYIIIDNTLY